MEGNRSLAVVTNALSTLGIPQLYISVERSREECLAIRSKGHPAHSSGVTHVGSLHVSFIVHVPDLHLRVHASRKKKMSVCREEFDALHCLRMTRPICYSSLRLPPFVNHLRRQIGLFLIRRMQIGRRNDPRSTQIVLLVLAVEGRLGLVDRDTKTGRLEWVDWSFWILCVVGYFAGSNPLRVKRGKEDDFAHLLVLVSLQPHALPVGHFALLFRSHSILFFSLVVRPRSLPILHVRSYT